MKQRLRLLRTVIFISLITAGCTEASISAFETATGIRFTQEQHDTLLATELPTDTTVVVADSAPDPVKRWHDLAIQSGWDEARWPWLSCVIARESHGDPNAYNLSTTDRSYGLTQLNARAWHGRMVEFAGTEQAFFDPAINLRFALWLYDVSGPQNWRSRSNPCPND